MFTKYASLQKAIKNRIFNYISNASASPAYLIFKKQITNHSSSCKKTPLTSFYTYFFTSMTLASRNLLSQVSVLDVEDNLAHVITLAQLALQRGDIERAEAILQIGMKLCEENKIVTALPYVYDILITIALAKGENEKAEDLLVNAIEKLTQSGMADDDHYIVDFKLRLARNYSNEKKNDLAELGYKTCLEVQRLKIVQGDVSTRTGLLYVNILFWYSIHMARNDQYHDAQKMLTMAYDFSSKIKGLTPYQELVILFTLADLNMELGDYETALQNVKGAILLGQGMSTTDLPRLYVRLAKIYIKMGAFKQALDSVEEGIKLARVFNNVEVQEEAELVLKDIKKSNIK